VVPLFILFESSFMNLNNSASNKIETQKRILVAGATGQLGRHLLRELRERSYSTRALVRDKEGARGLAADELYTGDVTKPDTLRGACEGMEVVFSTVGASLSTKKLKDKRSYREIDYAGNKNLLDAARAEGVRRFVYISVFNGNLPRHLEYTRTHEDFVRELKQSGMDYTVVRPTGFFSAFAEILEMARRGPVPHIGAESARVNPIHEADLARYTVHAMESSLWEVAVGGSEVLTRRQIAEMAFDALGKRPSVVKVPAGVFKAMLPLIKLYDRRLHALFEFFVAVSQTDMIAPAYGTRRLEDFFRELARTQVLEKKA
jgi:uncharacterized protein YbjT (DUF2867 family)